MKTVTTWLFLLTFLLVGNIVYAQMGIGTTSPAPSSMLDVTSDLKGMLIPRMTEAQRLAIPDPETSLLVFQTDGIAGFYFNHGSPASPEWRLLGMAGESWLLAGNALSGTEYFGSTNLQPVKFYANGTEYMRLTESGNLGIGTTSPMAKLEVADYLQFDDDLSTYMGYQAGAADPSGLGNTGVGVRALYSLTTGEFNSAFGHVALVANTEGYDNSAFGVAAMNSNTSGSENAAFGALALTVNSEGDGNTAVGHSALYNNQNGNRNTAVGARGLFENLTGSDNTSFGNGALTNNISGEYNTAIGTQAGYENTTGSENTFLGPKAGDNNTTGSKNIAIGSKAELPDGTMDGQMVLGDQYTLFGDLLNSRIGIGTTAPTNKLHVVVEGDPLRLQGLSNSTETDVLVVDATGVVAKRGGTFGSFWSLNGNTLVGTEILGSVNASPLILYTNNTGRLGIHSNGHVGIPEPSPESLFEINGVDDEVQFIIRAADPQSNPNSLLQLRNKSNDILCALHSDDPTNVFLGTDAGRSNTLVPFSKEGRTNIFIGNGSGLYNGMGYQNIGFGYQSLYNQEHGFGNIAIGHEAGFGGSILNPETFNGNILLGYRAGYGLRENGDDNILIGNECGSTISIGNRNILIGNNLQPTSSTATRQLIIGSQTLLFGNMVSEFIGIGVTAPTHKLHVSSTANPLRLDGLQTTSQSDVLVVDANGVVSKRNGGFGTSWYITGNSGTDPANNFIGTTDSQPLVIKVNNNPAGRISPLVGQNLSFGYRALATNLGSRNTALGDHSMYVIEAGGDDNTAAGYRALHLIQQGDANSAFGTQSLYSTTSGVSNTGVGYHALYSNTTGSNNVAVGYASMSLDVSGSDNAALGIASLRSNTNGGNNTAIGGQSLYNITSGGSNVAVGFEAGFGAVGSVFQNNVMIGRSAGLRLDNGGSNNILIGYTAGAFLTTGQNNIVIGYNVDAPSPTGNYQMVIGAQDLLFGNISSKLIGIGTTAPTNKLHVVAASNPLRLEGLQTTTNTDVLVVSSTGVVSKTSMPGGNLWTRFNSKTYTTNVADFVGIGTSNPNSTLHIGSAANSSTFLTIQANDDRQVGIRFSPNGGNPPSVPPEAQVYFDGDQSILFQQSLSDIQLINAGINTVRINGSGNVGIGTTAPSSKLEVIGNNNSTQVVVRANATQSNTNPLVQLKKSDGTVISAWNSDDSRNVFLGVSAGRVNNVTGVSTEGALNTFLGSEAGYSNTTGTANTAVGFMSQRNTTNAEQNTSIGYASLNMNTTGDYNTAIGSWAGSVTTGNRNTSVGYSAGTFVETGSNNTALGSQADFGGDYSNSTVIGANAIATASNQVRLGDGNITTLFCQGAYAGTTTSSPNLFVNASGQIMRSTATNIYLPSGTSGQTLRHDGANWVANSVIFNNGTNVGIGTTNPTRKLDVAGTAKIGSNGTTITNMIKATVTVDVPNVPIAGFVDVTFSVSNAATTSTVYISPQNTLANGMGIVSARVVSAGTVEVRFMNFDLSGTAHDLPSMDYYVIVIE